MIIFAHALRCHVDVGDALPVLFEISRVTVRKGSALV